MCWLRNLTISLKLTLKHLPVLHFLRSLASSIVKSTQYVLLSSRWSRFCWESKLEPTLKTYPFVPYYIVNIVLKLFCFLLQYPKLTIQIGVQFNAAFCVCVWMCVWELKRARKKYSRKSKVWEIKQAKENVHMTHL